MKKSQDEYTLGYEAGCAVTRMEIAADADSRVQKLAQEMAKEIAADMEAHEMEATVPQEHQVTLFDERGVPKHSFYVATVAQGHLLAQEFGARNHYVDYVVSNALEPITQNEWSRNQLSLTLGNAQ